MSLFLAACLMLAADPPAEPKPTEKKPLFEDGDLVVMLGGTLIERAQEYGHWEAALQLAHPDKTLRFRNLGWSGDTVWAESRGQFDPPEAGYKRMIEQVTALKPDVIILGYGNAEALSRVDRAVFRSRYERLLDDLPVARKVLLSPVRPGITNKHSRLSVYASDVQDIRRAVVAIGGDRKIAVVSLDRAKLVDIGGSQTQVGTAVLLTAGDYESNLIHLSESGYRAAARNFSQLDGVNPALRLRRTEDPDGTRLLAAICRKNRLVFDRWRPQNVTYLFGFRKHEQGQNAAEIPQFDPLIEAADAEIDRIKRELSAAQCNTEERQAQR